MSYKLSNEIEENRFVISYEIRGFSQITTDDLVRS